MQRLYPSFVVTCLWPVLGTALLGGAHGWVIAEVEVEGTQRTDEGQAPVEAIWAWIELYGMQAGEWKLVGNVSNRRP